MTTEDKDPEKKTESLKSISEQYHLLFQSIKDYVILMLDTKGKIILSNAAIENILGYDSSEIINEHFSILYTVEDQFDALPEFELTKARSKGKFETETWKITKSAVKLWTDFSITPIYNEDTVLAGYSIILKDLSRKKAKENLLPTTDSKYRLLVDSVKDYAIFMLDPNGYIISWNEGATRLKGYSEEEILGKHFSVFYSKEARDEDYPAYELKQAVQRGRFEDEGWRFRKDGTKFYANVIISPIFNEQKELLGFSKITRDLTDRKNAEDELIKSEDKYRLLIEGVKDYAIFMLSPEGIIQSWNEGARKFKGYSDKEIIGKHFSIFYPEEARLKGFPEFELEQAIKRGRFEDEGWRIRKDGSRFYANVVITAIFNKDKKLLGFSKITRDLTERKEAEELLKISEERYRLLVDAVKDYAIFRLSPDGYIESWNEGGRRLIGYTEREILGKHFSIFYPDDIKNEYPLFELKQANKKGRYEDEGWRIRKDGSRFYANVVITALFDTQRELIGYSKIVRDLTEKKKNEEMLNRLNAELEKRVKQRTEELSKTIHELKKINIDLDNFIYTASHDLKAPVSNIEGLMRALYLELEEQDGLKGDVNKIMNLVNKSISKFQETIRDLTAVNESQRIDKEDVVQINVNDLIEDVKSSIDHLVQESKAHIIVENTAGAFEFSKVHMRSIIYNLITNAIKYRSPDRLPQIKIKSYKTPENFILEVTDNGLGIKPEHMDKIFLMFKRLHDHVEGSGIGLYIVRRITSNAGGKIEVESQEGSGTTFRVILPLKQT